MILDATDGTLPQLLFLLLIVWVPFTLWMLWRG
jgi:hypothetical protein